MVVMAKSPRPGAVKTRLSPPLTLGQAARLAGAAIADTVAAALASTAARCVVALDGPAGAWLPPGVVVVPQRGGDLGARLTGAVADAWAGCPVPTLVVGMDTPQLTPSLLDRVATELVAGACDAVLGPADDGGYWAIGVRRPVAGLCDGVPMSTDRTGAAQRHRLASLGLCCRAVPALRDVDVYADAEAVAASAPRTRFAEALRAIAPGATTHLVTHVGTGGGR